MKDFFFVFVLQCVAYPVPWPGRAWLTGEKKVELQRQRLGT